MPNTSVRYTDRQSCHGVYCSLQLLVLNRCQDTSDPGHFRPKTFRHHQTGAEMPKCLADTSALVLNCLDLQQTFLLQ